MKPFTLYNPETFEILVTIFAKEQPDNSTEKMAKNEVKPMYNVKKDTIFEGATVDEIEAFQTAKKLELKKNQYAELLATDWYFIRFQELGVEVPQEIIELRKAIRENK